MKHTTHLHHCPSCPASTVCLIETCDLKKAACWSCLRIENEAMRSKIRQFVAEYRDDTCYECGEEWPACRCKNGSWWREAVQMIE